MSSNDTEAVTGFTVTLTEPLVMFVDPPSFDEVRQAVHEERGLTTTRLEIFARANHPTVIEDGQPVVIKACQIDLEDIREVRYDSARATYSFKANHIYPWSRNNYRQSGLHYKFTVKWDGSGRLRYVVARAYGHLFP